MFRLQLFIASSRKKKNKGGKVNKTRQVANKAAATTYVYTWSRCLLTPISSWGSIFFLFLPSSHPLFVNCKQRKTSTRREISQVVVTCFLWLALFPEIPGRWRRHCPHGPRMSEPGCNLVSEGTAGQNGNTVATGKCVCGPSVPWCPNEPRPYDYSTRRECTLNLAAKMNYGKKLPLLAREITIYLMYVYSSYDSRAGNETKSKIPIYVSIQRQRHCLLCLQQWIDIKKFAF